MKLIKDHQLFFGCKIDSKLREGLAMARPGDRKYFEDPNSEFLRVVTFGDERWIGKVMKGGINANDVEDVQRNVISILRRIAPNVRISPSSIKIFLVNPDEEGVKDILPESAAEPENPGEGPYIDY